MTCLRSSKRTLEPSKTKYPLGKHPNNVMPYKIIPRYGIGAKCPMVRPQPYNRLQKPISGYQPQVGSERVALTKPSCPYVGQRSCPRNHGQSHYDLRSIAATDCNIIYNSRALTDPTSSKTHHPSNLQLSMQLAEKQTTRGMCICFRCRSFFSVNASGLLFECFAYKKAKFLSHFFCRRSELREF